MPVAWPLPSVIAMAEHDMVAAGVTGYLLLQLLSPADLASTDAAVRRGAEFLDAYAPPIAASLFVLALGCLIGGCVYRPPMAAPVAPAPVRQAPAAATPRA